MLVLAHIMVFLSIFFSLVFAVITAFLAAKKKRRATVWFLIGFLAGILGPIILFFLPPSEEDVQGDFINDWLAQKGKKRLLIPPSYRWHYILEDRSSRGPISSSDMERLYGEGKISGSTLVWHEGLDNWVRLETFF